MKPPASRWTTDVAASPRSLPDAAARPPAQYRAGSAAAPERPGAGSARRPRLRWCSATASASRWRKRARRMSWIAATPLPWPAPLANPIDNALRHAQARSSILVKVINGSVLEVAMTASGSPPRSAGGHLELFNRMRVAAFDRGRTRPDHRARHHGPPMAARSTCSTRKAAARRSA